MKRFLSVLLALTLFCSVFSFSLNANAAEADEGLLSKYSLSSDEADILVSGASIPLDYVNVNLIKNHLINHDESFNIKSTIDSSDGNQIKAFVRDMFYEAMKHTGVSNEGDYIRFQLDSWESNMSVYTFFGKRTLSVDYNVVYFTTPKLESELDKKVSSIIKSLNLDGKEDCEKIKAIHDYICDNVTYDYDAAKIVETYGNTSDPLPHSAYAALCKGKAVCQGYALAFYRLALECNIDVRIISGVANGGSHAWNIVKIKDKYYLLDTTFDDTARTLAYFLKSEADFPDHAPDDEFKTAEFKKDYPISSKSFDYDAYLASLNPHYKIIGDFSGDGTISSDDSLLVLRASVGLETVSNENFEIVDVDGDGDISSFAALEILRYSVGLSVVSNVGKKIA